MSFQTFLKRRWFLVGLFTLIPVGLVMGWQLPSDTVLKLASNVPARPITAIVLFLMAFSLNSSALGKSLRRPQAVILASLVNYAGIPLVALLLMKLQSVKDYRIGIMIAASVPCTMASCSVWTRKAGGNDAVSLLVTLVTNGICFVVTPFWLYMATRQNVDLGFDAMVTRLAQAVLLPCLLGQLLRLSSAAGEFATRNKTRFGVIAQSLILALVFAASLKAGERFQLDEAAPGLGATILVLVSCIVLHLLAMVFAVNVSKAIGIALSDRKAIAFASSQKTLPVGILMADAFVQVVGVTFVVFPMLMFHASQLLIDTFVADWYSRQAAEQPVETDLRKVAD